MSDTETVPLDQTLIGVMLAENVLDTRGRTLLAKGVTLDADTCALLMQREVEQVTILRKIDTQTQLDRQQALQARLEARFSQVLDDPLMQNLFEIIKQHRGQFRS